MIKRIAIKNFKSLDVDFMLDPVTVLVGRSGTGKTNLVEGVRFLRDFLRGKTQLEWPLVSATTGEENSVHFELEFNVKGVTGTFRYVLDFKYKRGHNWQLQQEKLALDKEILFHVQSGQWSKMPSVRDLPDPSKIVLPALTGMHEVSIAHVVLTDGLGCHDFPGTVCTQDGSDGPIGEGVNDAAGNFAAAFEAIRSNLSRLIAWKEINSILKCLNASFEMIDTGDPRGKRLIVGHKFRGQVLTLDIARESEGFRRFFAHLIALYQSPPKQTLVFEEPEKGIHPGALATLAEELKSCPSDGRGQVVITTHSPGLLDHFAPENIRVVEMENCVTKIGSVDPAQLEALKERLLKPGELLTVDPARIGDAL
ncbi:MAG: ATP-binding protein [Verrucomicrobia bacterium]|nr:ATP-binding protein [Verrucomicrobiota bacterium]